MKVSQNFIISLQIVDEYIPHMDEVGGSIPVCSTGEKSSFTSEDCINCCLFNISLLSAFFQIQRCSREKHQNKVKIKRKPQDTCFATGCQIIDYIKHSHAG